MAWALVCSGAFHALMGLSAAAWIAWRPAPPPKHDVAPVLLHAKLEDFRAAPVTLELIPVERTVTEPVPILMPAPTLPIPAVNDSPRRPAPVVRPNIAAADPNGSVVMGQLEDPSLLGRIVAARLGQRYTATPDREPRLIGSLIVPYPPEARQARVSARIAAVLDIDAQGAITNISLVPDHRWFGPAVMDVLKDARFTPA
ncbi:MAG TPA: hypothetical protein VFB54_09295, partial [Burkholderiales bacterium]|nr:hypothetical protein [Burkholderiales bacterium]